MSHQKKHTPKREPEEPQAQPGPAPINLNVTSTVQPGTHHPYTNLHVNEAVISMRMQDAAQLAASIYRQMWQGYMEVMYYDFLVAMGEGDVIAWQKMMAFHNYREFTEAQRQAIMDAAQRQQQAQANAQTPQEPQEPQEPQDTSTGTDTSTEE